MEDNDRGALIRRALLLAVGDMDYVHHATGLFAKEVRHRRGITAVHSSKMAKEKPNSSKYSQLLNEARIEHVYDPDLIKQIKTYFSKLEKMPADELIREVEVKQEASMAKEEAAQLFNQDSQMLVEPLHWARQSIWSPQEAVLLLMEREPNQDVLDALGRMPDYTVRASVFASTYFNILGIMKTAIEVGEISSPGKPLEYLKWFRKVRYDAPVELVASVLEIHAPDNANASTLIDLKPSERDSLLKLVAGMAIGGYSFDQHSKRNKATEDIQADLDRLGIGLDNKTILKWIRAGCTLIGDDKD